MHLGLRRNSIFFLVLHDVKAVCITGFANSIIFIKHYCTDYVNLQRFERTVLNSCKVGVKEQEMELLQVLMQSAQKITNTEFIRVTTQKPL